MKLLTKTDFILYRDCARNVWNKWHLPEEYRKFEVSEFEKSLGVMGNEVEEMARGMFPGGYLVEKRSEGAQELTEKLIKERHPVIFQPVFSTDRFLAAADVIVWNTEANAYDVYEIKMSSTDEEEEDESGKPKKINKKKEEQFEYDLAFQVNVAKLCGVNFNKKYLVRLNRDYVRVGDLDYSKLFKLTDKTEELYEDRLSAILSEMEGALSYLSQDKMPVGPCECYYKGRSSHCTSFTLSNPQVPAYSVHDLNRIGNSKKYLKELLDEGILEIDQVPEDDRLHPKPAKANEKQTKPRKLNQVRVHKTKQPIVDLDAIKKELDSLQFPLYFLDYETYPTAIPPFSGYSPYQHIVFQYSLHILNAPDAAPEHRECLVLEGDPAEQIVAGLRKDIGNVGTVISWNKKFENSRNKELARLIPAQKEFLHDVIKRTYDLMDIVDQQHYVHHGFRGSASIKKVQEVLAPEFAYKKLGVKNGTEAIEAYRQISRGELTGDAAEKKRREMLEYCKYDTEVMYVIWRRLQEMIR
ncbi:MAG: DUF2779 domain-containing protein [Candidatus Paceibacterota bacterium]